MIIQKNLALLFLCVNSFSFAMHEQASQGETKPCKVSFLYGIKRPKRVDTWNEEWDILGNHAIMQKQRWKILAYAANKKVGKLEYSGTGDQHPTIVVKDGVDSCTQKEIISALTQEYFGKRDKA